MGVWILFFLMAIPPLEGKAGNVEKVDGPVFPVDFRLEIPPPVPEAEELFKISVRSHSQEFSGSGMARPKNDPEGGGKATKIWNRNVKENMGRPPRKSHSAALKTVTVRDKPLVFAGRGFEIRGFESHGRNKLYFDFTRHFRKPYPHKKVIPSPGHLDRGLSQVRSSRELIFHPLKSAWGRNSSREPEPQKILPTKKNVPVKKIPETLLRFSENGKTQLMLRPGGEALDLLRGNENVNRHRYQHW